LESLSELRKGAIMSKQHFQSKTIKKPSTYFFFINVNNAVQYS